MLRNLVRLSVLLVAVLLFAGGCDLFGTTYTIEIKNYSTVWADIYYRQSGDTSWTRSVSLLADQTAYEEYPAGVYDFRTVWTGEDPDDPDWIIGTETNCELDLSLDFEGDGGQTYDYHLTVSNDSLSFY